MKDTLKMKGIVNLWCYSATGELLWHDTINNLIVNTGKGKMAHLLAGVTTGNFINQIGAGTSSTGTLVTDTALTGAAVIAIGSATYPTATSVKFAFTFGTGDANGITIVEFGLITGDGTLFSRVTRPAIVKTSAISIVGTWEIDF